MASQLQNRLAMKNLLQSLVLGCLLASTGCADHVVDASSSSTAAATASMVPRVAVAVPKVETLRLVVNLADGFAEAVKDDVYVVDFVAGTASLNGNQAVPVSAAQAAAISSALDAMTYHETTRCFGGSVDGGPYPPELSVIGAGSERGFQVSDAPCSRTDHSATGEVVGCASYASLFDAVATVLPGGKAPGCADYW